MDTTSTPPRAQLASAVASACLEVPLNGRAPAAATSHQPTVLGAIENLPAATHLIRSPQIKKQRQLQDAQQQQGPPPLDAAALFAQARALLRQLPSGATQQAPSGREAQYRQLQEVLQDFADIGNGSSLYVSGLPGTGEPTGVGGWWVWLLQFECQFAQPDGADKREGGWGGKTLCACV